MRKFMLFVILTATIFIDTNLAQTGIYLGYENGFKFDRFNYINSKGYSVNKPSFNEILGGYIGYKLDRYTFESGFYFHYTSIRIYDYNRSTGTVGGYVGGTHGNEMDNFIIPLRFGMEFNMVKNRIFIKPEIGFTGIIARDYSKIQPSSWWSENTRWDSIFIPTNGDSTITCSYRTSKFNLGYEVSLSAGFRIKKKFDIYFKGSLLNSLKPLFYETITYYSDAGNETATIMFHGNSISIQIGLRYLFEIKKKI
jgi:hypothetical protein